LIYSDLALFVLDSRSGITHNDVMLYRWLTQKELRLPSQKKVEKNKDDEVGIEFSEDFKKRMEELGEELPKFEPGKIPGLHAIRGDKKTKV
jgi:predicted GTPase